SNSHRYREIDSHRRNTTYTRSAAIRIHMFLMIPKPHASTTVASFRQPNVLPLSRVRPFARGCATQRVAPNEPRKRRASERPHVGSCGELARRSFGGHSSCCRARLTNFGGREPPEPITFAGGVADHLVGLASAMARTTGALMLGPFPF